MRTNSTLKTLAGWDDDSRLGTCNMLMTDRDVELRTFMHYTDPLAGKEEITVFGAARKGLFYNYSDRLDGQSWNDGCKKASKHFQPKTAAWFEAVLKHFHQAKELTLEHVMLGCNRSNGYSYMIFGYTYTS